MPKRFHIQKPFWYEKVLALRCHFGIVTGMTLNDFLSNEPTKMSHAAFGKKIGVEQATVTRYLNGERFPPPETIRKIVEATKGKVTANDLLIGFENAKRASEEKKQSQESAA
jgi:transcriptional regulator with XRE-family HTH domain